MTKAKMLSKPERVAKLQAEYDRLKSEYTGTKSLELQSQHISLEEANLMELTAALLAKMIKSSRTNRFAIGDVAFVKWDDQLIYPVIVQDVGAKKLNCLYVNSDGSTIQYNIEYPAIHHIINIVELDPDHVAGDLMVKVVDYQMTNPDVIQSPANEKFFAEKVGEILDLNK
ncbi:hypothetical protein [Ewingella americana]|uniref:Uncharacterized protein n=1 Tax=Ewingella americana TaxID=41202 RepID=A0A502GD72_9GAMM|nr:hypothetical protein [Ewingella americana]TPG60049.1 hypothetical protein EAH77_15900 [Ewingella americana]